MSKRILFIDDIRDPFGKLSEFCGFDPEQDEVVWVKTSKEALETLARDKEWDAIFWDHDLSGNDTSMVVAQTLCELAFHEVIDPEHFALNIIITSNPVGRVNLRETLQRWNFNTRDLYLHQADGFMQPIPRLHKSEDRND